LPNRTHRARHDPPSVTDRLLAHPYETTVIGGLWTAIGAVLTGAWLTGIGPSTILSALPAWQASLVPILLLSSGIGVLTAIFWRGRDSTAWGIELVMLPLGAAAWLAYGIAAPSWAWQLVSFAFFFGATGRYIAAILNRRNPAGALVIDGKVHLPK